MKITRRQLRQIIRTTLSEGIAGDAGEMINIVDFGAEDLAAAMIELVYLDPDFGDVLSKIQQKTGVMLTSQDEINNLALNDDDYKKVINYLDSSFSDGSSEEDNMLWATNIKLINQFEKMGLIDLESEKEKEKAPEKRSSRVSIEWVPDDGTDKTIEWLKNEMIYDKEILPWLKAVSSIESFDDCDDADDFDRCVSDRITAATGVVWFDYEDQLMGQEEKTTWPQIARHILQKIK